MNKKLDRAEALEAEAAKLRQEAFDGRPLPDFWRVGQKVRTLEFKDWAWERGQVGTIIELDRPGTPAREYQVFWITFGGKFKNSYWTTPRDVELVKDVDATVDLQNVIEQ